VARTWLGGFVPLSPYVLLTKASSAFGVSVATTLLALGLFGYVKGRVAGARAGRSALETVLIGGLAAAAALLIARAIA
jgi:VIT1/CCC1 family predicted Fe2+/Mn2+ transporter